MPLVMTSGNRSDEPIAYDDDDALERLAGIADLFLIHDRPDPRPLRRFGDARRRRRRAAAAALARLRPAADRAAVGVSAADPGRRRPAQGDVRPGPRPPGVPQPSPRRPRSFRGVSAPSSRTSPCTSNCSHIQPELIVHDLHPDYASTRYARSARPSRASQLLAVQHHHAHMASCMAENGLTEPVIGVTFDGTGYGTDGAIWGGEFLVGDYRRVSPGGPSALRRHARRRAGDPRAVADGGRPTCADAGRIARRCEARFRQCELRTVERMLERRFNTPLTSSAGRLFDAVAALAGVRDRVSYEGQAAMELEWLATRSPPDGVVSVRIAVTPRGRAAGDRYPAARSGAVAADAGSQGVEPARDRPAVPFDPGRDDRRGLRPACGRRPGSDAVVLSGGVFLNALLTAEATRAAASATGFRVYRHRLVPPNDGGLEPGPARHRRGQRPRDRRSKETAMCLGIPGQGGRDLPRARRAHGQGRFRRRLQARLPGARPRGRPGDYVLVHVGFALSRIDEAEARRVFEFLER